MGEVEITKMEEDIELTFSEPIEYTVNEDVFHRIYINKEKMDGEEVSLIRKHFSPGLKENRKYRTLSFPIYFKKGDEFIGVFKSIVEKCKDHLMDISTKSKVKELKGLKLSDLSNFGSCLSDKNGKPSVLHVKVSTKYNTGKIIPEFYEKKKMDLINFQS